MNQIIEKTCVTCGLDLQGQKRVKDAMGRYFCPSCWAAQTSELSDPIAASSMSAVSPDGPKSPAVKVRIVGSTAPPSVAKAIATGAKSGVKMGLLKSAGKAFVFGQLIVVLGLTKKFFPDTSSGMMIFLVLTLVNLGVAEVELGSRAMGFGSVWVDADLFRTRAGIFVLIGMGLAYALAIFLAFAGG